MSYLRLGRMTGGSCSHSFERQKTDRQPTVANWEIGRQGGPPYTASKQQTTGLRRHLEIGDAIGSCEALRAARDSVLNRSLSSLRQSQSVCRWWTRHCHHSITEFTTFWIRRLEDDVAMRPVNATRPLNESATSQCDHSVRPCNHATTQCDHATMRPLSATPAMQPLKAIRPLNATPPLNKSPSYGRVPM